MENTELKAVKEQIQAGMDKILNETHLFKQDNDKRFKEIEAKGKATADLEQKVEKQAASLTAQEEKIEKILATVNRTATNLGDGKEDPKEVEKKMSGIMNTFLKKGRESVSAEDRKYYNEQLVKQYNVDELKTLSVGSEIDGGYFVRPQVSARINEKVFESSPMEELADSITIGTDAFEEGYDESEVGSESSGEGGSQSVTDAMTFKMLRIPTHVLQAKPKATLNILEDASIDMEAYLDKKVGEKWGRDRAYSFINGLGTGVNIANAYHQAKGILSYTSGDGFNLIEQVESENSASYVADDFISVQNALLEQFQNNACWLMKRATMTAVRKLKSGDGHYLLGLEGDITKGGGMTLLGRPVKYADHMPAVAASSLSVAYGDFKQGYLIVNRLGVSVLRDPFTVDGHVLYKFRTRFGGGVRQFQAIKILKAKA